MAARPQMHTVLHCLNTGIMGSDPVKGTSASVLCHFMSYKELRVDQICRPVNFYKRGTDS
jgi:hypothetical protein